MNDEQRKRRNARICKEREEKGTFYWALAKKNNLSEPSINKILAAGRKAKRKPNWSAKKRRAA